MYSIPILAVGMSIYLYKTNKYQIIHCSNMALKKRELYTLPFYKIKPIMMLYSRKTH